MSTYDPQIPVRADHRFIKKMLSSVLSGKVEDKPEEFDLISQFFVKAGGSWSQLFHGSPDEFSLLKKVIKAFYKKGLLTKTPNWSA